MLDVSHYVVYSSLHCNYVVLYWQLFARYEKLFLWARFIIGYAVHIGRVIADRDHGGLTQIHDNGHLELLLGN